jgi:hypothetical protein
MSWRSRSPPRPTEIAALREALRLERARAAAAEAELAHLREENDILEQLWREIAADTREIAAMARAAGATGGALDRWSAPVVHEEPEPEPGSQ